MDQQNSELVSDISRAYDLAQTEDQIRSVLGRNAEGEVSIISRVSEFLTDNKQFRTSWHWKEGTSVYKQVEDLGALIGDLACITEQEMSNAYVTYLIFSGSDLFKPFHMLGSDLNIAEEIATRKINAEFTNGNYVAYDAMDQIIRYLRQNIPEM